MAASSSESARTEVSSPVPPCYVMFRCMTGSEPGGEGRADIVKLYQAIEARLGSFCNLEKGAKKCSGSCDATNPFSYRLLSSGVNLVLGHFRPEIFKKRTQSGIAKVKKELGPKLACSRPGFFDVNFAQKEALFCLPETNSMGVERDSSPGIAAFRAGILV